MLEAEVGQCDAVLLSPLSEDAFLHNLHIRFKRDIIYTYVGNMLISVNPCRELPFYSSELVRSYLARAPYQMPPHIYAIAATAYRWLRDRNESQCIVMTGESGSGKTEAARVCLQCCVLAGGVAGAGAGGVAERLTAAGTLLEAFGNATTQRNHNASRFGKHLDVEYDFKGDPLGGHITHYLLEKSRVTRLQPGDRNFHVFYQLLAGADVHLLKYVKLQRGSWWYRILGGGEGRGGEGGWRPSPEPATPAASPHRRRTSATYHDRHYFTFTKTAMDTLGFTPEEISDIFKILAAILKLGNVEFVPSTNIDGTIGCSIDNEYELEEACAILGADSSSLASALGAGAAWGNTREEDGAECGGEEAMGAAAARDILLAAIYGRLFTWIINRVNGAIKPKSHGKRNTLGILDLYGFESLQSNSLKQLLINYANERLQAALAGVTLCRQQGEYAREQVEWQRILYFDNEPICELIDAGQHGLLSLAGECSSRGAGDLQFLQRVRQCHSGSQHLLVLPPHHFQVRHYAGTVTYDVRGMVEKNADTLPLSLSAVMHSATHTMMKDLFPDGVLCGPRRPAPLGCRQRVAMAALARRLAAGATPRVVRCLRADEAHRPRHFDVALVRHQVRTQCIMETLQLRRTGHCECVSAEGLVSRYGLLRRTAGVEADVASRYGLLRRTVDVKADAMRECRALLRSLPIPSAEFTYGRTKVFIRSPRTVFELEEFRSVRVWQLATCVQVAWREWRRRRVARARVQAQKTIARAWRLYKSTRCLPERQALLKKLGTRRRVLSMQQDKRVVWAATTIQRHYVQWMRLRYLLTLWRRLPAAHMSPLCASWPPAPADPQLLSTHQLLRHLHHRWRCYKYRLNFDQTARNRMREKVTASIIFKDRKQNYPRSVSHPFVGDYVRLRASAQWRRACAVAPPAAAADYYVVFADIVNKVARSSGKVSPALVVVSTGALLVLDARSLRVKRRLPAHAVYRLSLSPHHDDLLVVHARACPTLDSDDSELTSQCSSHDGGDSTGCLFGSDSGRRKGDLVLQTCHVLEMATKLFLVVQNAVGKPPQVNISSEFEANFGQQIVTISFQVCGVGGEQPRIVRRASRMDVLL